MELIYLLIVYYVTLKLTIVQVLTAKIGHIEKTIKTKLDNEYSKFEDVHKIKFGKC